MEKKEILINSLKLIYYEKENKNNEEKILILHGWRSSFNSWQKVFEGLSSFFSVVFLELPGFGQSETPSFSFDLEDYLKIVNLFCEKKDLDKFYLVGHSFGGAISFLFTVSFPEKVKKLVLCAPAIFRFHQKSLKQKIFILLSKMGNKVFNQKIPFLFKKNFYRLLNNYDYFALNDVMKETFKKIIKRDLRDNLSLLKTPTLILWGEKDKILPPSQAFFLKEKIEKSELEILPKVGHAISLEAPDLLVQKIISFLKK